MANTKRAHVTIEESYWKLLEELVDVFGPSIPQVISNIITYFFNDPKNDALLEKLRARKRKEKPPDPEEIEKDISKYLKISNNIPFDKFLNHLKLDTDFAISQLEDWGKKFGFIIDNNKIVKIEK